MRKKEQKQPEDQTVELKKTYLRCFSGKDGKTVLEDLESRGWMRTSTISPEPHVMVFREGQRSVMLYIRTMMDIDPKRIREIMEMMEAQNAEPEL